MANVPYDDSGAQKVLPETRMPDDYQRVQATPSSFGGAIAQGEEQVGQNISKVGQLYGQVAADDASNNFQDATTRIMHGDPSKMVPGPDGKPQPDLGYLGLRGRAASDARASTVQQVDDILKQTRAGLYTTESQLQFDSFSRRYRSYLLSQIGSHADQQMNEWYKTVNGATVQAGLRHISANPTDPDAVAAGAADATHGLVKNAELNGAQKGDPVWNDAVAKGKQVSVQTQVEALMTTNATMAKRILDTNKGAMLPEVYDALAGRLRPMLAGADAPAAIEDARQEGAAKVSVSKDQYPSGEVRSGTNVDAVAPQLVTRLSGDLGLTKDQAAGVVGWLAGESMLNSGSVNQGGLGGKDTGLAQWVGPRKKALLDYAASVGADPMAQETQVQFLEREIQSPQYAKALAAVRAAPTVEAANRAFGDFYEGASGVPVPRYQAHVDWAKYVSTLLGGASPDDVTAQLPDKGRSLQLARERAGSDPIQARMNVAEVNRIYAEQNAATATQRYQIEQQAPDLIAAAEAGVQGITFPEDTARSVLPSAKAEHLIGEFHAAQAVGDVMRGVEWASPQDVDAMQRDVSSGQGVLSDAMRLHAHGMTTGPGSVQTPEEISDDNASFFRLRQGAARRLSAEIERRNAMLVGPSADPASYASANPTVRTAAAGIDPKKPGTFGQYATTTLGLQQYLGVPEGQRHVLTREQALGLAGQIASSSDPKSAFQTLQAQYGPAWDHVFADASSLGRLPVGYQAVQALDDPHDAALLSRTIASEKPSPDGKPARSVDDTVDIIGGKGEASRIRDSVRSDPETLQYVASIRRSGASDNQVQSIVNAVETLALAKRASGDAVDSTTASAAAAKSFFGKFEYMPNGGARVPAAQSDAVTANAAAAVGAITVGSVAVPPLFGRTGAPSPEEYVDLLKANPTWVTAPRGDALWLMDNGGRIVRDRSGQPLQVPFSAPAPSIAEAPNSGFMRGGYPVPGL